MSPTTWSASCTNSSRRASPRSRQPPGAAHSHPTVNPHGQCCMQGGAVHGSCQGRELGACAWAVWAACGARCPCIGLMQGTPHIDGVSVGQPCGLPAFHRLAMAATRAGYCSGMQLGQGMRCPPNSMSSMQVAASCMPATYIQGLHACRQQHPSLAKA